MLMDSALAAWRCGGNSGRCGAQDMRQNLWLLLAVLGGCMCCLVIHLLKLLNMRVRKIL